jgi:hypothetical protein
MRMLALLAGSWNHRSLPVFSISLFASRAGATMRSRLRNWPVPGSARDQTCRLLPSVCLPCVYSVSDTVSEKG